MKKVLDHGYVDLTRFSGGDIDVIKVARTSFNRDMETSSEKSDKALISYLMTKGHGTPFEQSTFQILVRCPILVARQWIRHRMCSYNEVSARYTTVSDEFYIPGSPRLTIDENEQGNLDPIELITDAIDSAHSTYKQLLEMGVHREVARCVLPLSMYTKFYWHVNARSLMNFLQLRLHTHAQWEIRQYAAAVLSIFEENMPQTAEAFKLHVLEKGLSSP